MKTGKKILIAILAMLCVVAAAVGIIGCGGKPTASETKYDVIYNAYVEALNDAGKDAMAHDDWYDVYMNSIDAANLGTEYEIESAEFVTDGVEYVEFVINSKIYRLSLEGSDFIECVVFTLTVKDENDAALVNTYLDIYYENNGERVVWRTIRTDATTGTFALYVPAKDTKTYGVVVSTRNNTNHTFGIPYGEEPTFSVSSTDKNVEVVLYEATTYIIRVNNVLNRQMADVAVGIFYNDADNETEIAGGVTDATGTLTLYFVMQDTHSYVVKFRDVPNAIPEFFYSEQESWDLTFESNGTGLTLITLSKGVEYIDHDLDVSGNPEVQLAVSPKYEPVPVNMSLVEEGLSLEELEKDQNGAYSWNGMPLYVALSKLVARDGAKWSILNILEEDSRYFLGTELHYNDETNPEHDEDIAFLENVWDRYNYYNMLTTYAGLSNADGLYALNDDLLRFVTSNANLFPGAETGSETNWLLPVMYYEGPKLGIGEEAAYENFTLTSYGASQPSMSVRSDIPSGFYRVIVDIDAMTTGGTINIVVDGYYYRVITTTTRDPYGNTTTTRSVVIYLPEGTTSITPMIDTAGSRTATFTLESLGEAYTVDQIDTNGEYLLPLYPSSYMPSNIVYQLPGFTKLYQRKYYTYTTEILELPEGVNSITGVYSINDASRANVIEKYKLQVGDVKELECYDKDMSADRVPKMLFMYDDKGSGETLFVKVKMTFVNNRVNISYSGGEGAEGRVAMNEGVNINATITLPNNGFTKEGYTFVGWTLDGGETLYKPGAKYTITSHEDITFTAVWRAGGNAVIEDETLGVGEDGKLTLTIDANTYTGVEIGFTSGITATRYYLTADFGERNLGKQLTLTLLNSNGNVTKTSFLMYSAAKSEEGHNVYVAYIDKAATDVKFAISTVEYEGTINAELTLTAYNYEAEYVLGETVEVPLNSSSVSSYSNAFRIGYGEGITASAYYRMFITNTTEITLSITLYRYTTSSLGSVTLNPGETGVITFQAYSSLTNNTYYSWLKAGTAYYATLSVRLEEAYTVTYAKGLTDATGSVPTTGRYSEGETFVLPTTTLARADYEFMGWTTGDDYEYDASKTYMQPGDKFEMPGENITITAVWRALVYSRASIGIGDAAKGTLTINNSEYDGYQLDFLREVGLNNYKLTAEINVYVGERILLSTNIGTKIYLVYNGNLSSEGKYVYVTVMVITENDTYVHFNIDTDASAKATFKLEVYEQATLEANGDFIDVVYNPYNTSKKIVIPVGESVDARYYKLYIETTLSTDGVFPQFDFYYGTSRTSVTKFTDSVFGDGTYINVPAGVSEFYLIGYGSSDNYYMFAFSIRIVKLYSATYTGGDGATGSGPTSQTLMFSGEVFAVAYNNYTKTNCNFLGWKNIADEEDEKLYQPGELITITDKDYKFEAQWSVDPNAGGDDESSEYTVEDKIAANSSVTVKLDTEYDLITVELDEAVENNSGYYVTADFGSTNIGNAFIVTVGDSTLYLVRGLGANPTDETNIYVGWIWFTATARAFTFSTSYVEEDTTFTLSLGEKIPGSDKTTTIGTVNLNSATYVDIPVIPYNLNSSTTSWRFRLGTKLAGTHYMERVNLTSFGTISAKINGGNDVNPNTKGTGMTTTIPVGSSEYALSSINNNIGVGQATQLYYIGTSSSTSKVFITISIKIYTRVTLSYNKNTTDSVTGNTTSSTGPGGAIVKLAECGFARIGYSFIGWSTKSNPGEEDTIYQPGDLFQMGTSNTTMYAQWRQHNVDEIEQTLGLGATYKVSNVAVNLKSYDSVQIPFGTVEEGAYVVTATLAKDLGAKFFITVGTKRIMLERDESVTGKFVYVGYLNKDKDDEVLLIPQLLNGEEEFTITEMLLSEYVAPTVKADGEFVEVVLNSYGVSNSSASAFKAKLDPSYTFDANHQYRIYLKAGDNYETRPSLSVYLGGSSTSASDAAYTETGISGAKFSGEDLTLFLYNSTSSSYSGKYYVAVSMLYNVTYDPGVPQDDEAPVTGGTVDAQNYNNPGTTIALRDNYQYTRASHAFIGWTPDGGTTIYYPGDKYVVNGDTVFSAVWTSGTEKFSGATLGLGEENKVTNLKLNPAEYTDLTVDLVEFANAFNYYYLTLDLSEDYGDWFMITTNYTTKVYLNHKNELDTDGHHIYTGYICTVVSANNSNAANTPEEMATTLQLTTYNKSLPAATVNEIRLEEKKVTLNNMSHDTVEIYVNTKVVGNYSTFYNFCQRAEYNSRTFLAGNYNIWVATKAPVAAGSYVLRTYQTNYTYYESSFNRETPIRQEVGGNYLLMECGSYVNYGFTVTITIERA